MTFKLPRRIDADNTAEYNFYPGLPVMGIWEHYTATGRYLLAFDTKRMCKYNTATSLLNDMAEEDTWTAWITTSFIVWQRDRRQDLHNERG